MYSCKHNYFFKWAIGSVDDFFHPLLVCSCNNAKSIKHILQMKLLLLKCTLVPQSYSHMLATGNGIELYRTSLYRSPLATCGCVVYYPLSKLRYFLKEKAV